jgi:dephospho-CoA kinase
MAKVVAIVGMTGSGKSEVARIFENNGFAAVRFGDVTDEEVKKRGLELNEENERRIREELREGHGMDAYAKLNLHRIDSALQSSNVVVDGLYSWEEYILMRDYYRGNFCMVAVCASPGKRYKRLAGRSNRGLTREEAVTRDTVEIEKMSKGGPIAMADFTIVNESSLEDLERETERVVSALR